MDQDVKFMDYEAPRMEVIPLYPEDIVTLSEQNSGSGEEWCLLDV